MEGRHFEENGKNWLGQDLKLKSLVESGLGLHRAAHLQPTRQRRCGSQGSAWFVQKDLRQEVH